MAKRTTTKTQTDDLPDYLIKPKKKFEDELNQRISIGAALLERQISNSQELSKLNEEHSFWHDFNAELIKRAFNKANNEYYRSYTLTPGIYIGSLYNNPSFNEKVQEAKSKVSSHLNRLKKIKEKLILIEELPGIKVEDESSINLQKIGLSVLTTIFSKFHKVAQSLRHRHGGRETLLIKDEYDVQDLLRSILQINFDDVREEDYSPSYAGGNSRVDFALKEEKIIVETKMTNDSLKDKDIGSQLLIDIGRYRSHPDCQLLVVFVYDKGDNIRNKVGLINDLEKMSTTTLQVKIFINPK